MSDLPESVDVLVVGYGPVGATVGCLLGQYGVKTLVVDRAPDILMMPRAIALDNEALRILQLAGLPEGSFAFRAIPRVRMHSPYVGEFAQINSCGSLDGHPKLVTFYQPELERALRARVSSYPNVITATCVEMLGFTDQADGVRAQLRTVDGRTSEVHCRYLVAADGAGSSIRRLIGQDFTGSTYPEDWLVVDAKRANQTLDHIEFVCDPRRPTPHMPAPGNRERWEFMLHPGETREKMEQEATVRELLAPYGRAEDMRLERTCIYRFHARTCGRFSSGHVYLAGDAAHITPPFVGQGLVAGLRDAANLSWKLAWAVKGYASETILESYDQERRPHAKAIIDLARFMGHLIMPRGATRAVLIHGLVRLLRVLPSVRSFFDDLKIKPRNSFKQGLFAHDPRDHRSLGGTWLPQGLVRSADGRIQLSDGLLGDRLVMIGLGLHPAQGLDEPLRKAWRGVGGEFLRINARGDLPRGSDEHEDLTGVLVPGMATPGQIVLVRPDRTILHSGPAADAMRLVRESLALLGIRPGEMNTLTSAPETSHS
jgi:3-(3-hydroxy-phenyl)propionate hydroxylase